MADLTIPEGLWDAEAIPEGIVSNWFYADGAAVTRGTVVAEIMVEKTTFEIAAPADGVLTRSVAKDGVIRPGTVIGTIDGG
jgi:pyruvate/2-oxoglutarate dehydrogenase complex dihydrolipoamide acyltransferase (E2) component